MGVCSADHWVDEMVDQLAEWMALCWVENLVDWKENAMVAQSVVSMDAL